MENAIAFANNDVILIAWSYGRKPEGCMGFALYRIMGNDAPVPLPSLAVFKNFPKKDETSSDKTKPKIKFTTENFPIQKFYWKDPYARLVAEKTGQRKFRYKIVPLEGTAGQLKPMTSLSQLVTNEVELTAEMTPGLRAYFNRGLISTQRISKAFKGDPNKTSLLSLIANPSNPLRASLSGDMVEVLTGFVDRAKTSGKIYAALYELDDKELLDKLMGLGDRLNIILSNAEKTVDKKSIDSNADARELLAKSGCTKIDRILPSGQIGHNKFLVYVDGQGKPQSVLFGSTNWTATGLCTQTNNTVVLDAPRVAARYIKYWHKLAKDCAQAKDVAKNLQGTVLRGWDGKGRVFRLAGGETLQSWFSPNTGALRKRTTRGEQVPVDMAVVSELIAQAKHAVLLLAFDPGSPSVTQWAGAALHANKNLFVRGCVTNISSAEGFYYSLIAQDQPKHPKKSKKNPNPVKVPFKEDYRVIAAEAFDRDIVPIGWQKELLNAGFAVVHDKIVVIDPFADNCTVVTGSHNLGHRASFNNDENLAIIQGNKKLAVAYATHVLDVYDHFSWRYRLTHGGKKSPDQYLKETPEEWLAKYFDAAGNIRNAQLDFWMQAHV